MKIPSPRETAASTWLARSITASGVCAASSSRRIHWRSSGLAVACAATCSTKKRYAAAVGTRPAEVCGWYRKPASSRSAITLRTVAELSGSTWRLAMLREETGSPVSMYSRTTSVKNLLVPFLL